MACTHLPARIQHDRLPAKFSQSATRPSHFVIRGSSPVRPTTTQRGPQWGRIFGWQDDTWGCQDQWGNLDITVIPASTGVVAYQTPDKRSGCPSKAGANKALISRTITVGKPAIAIVQGHMIRSAPGRRDLYLYVDGKLKDRTLTFTSSKQWEDAAVYWSGNLGKGKHTIYNAPGRRDLHLWLDNSPKNRTLTYSSSRQWEDTSSSRPVRVSLRTGPRTLAEAARPRPAPTPRSSRKTSHSASRRSSSPRVI